MIYLILNTLITLGILFIIAFALLAAYHEFILYFWLFASNPIRLAVAITQSVLEPGEQQPE